jgi:hypothetical protein
VQASGHSSDDIDVSQIETDCYDNSDIDDYGGSNHDRYHNNDNTNNNNNINQNDYNKDNDHSKETNSIRNNEKRQIITEKKNLKSHKFFENIKWDFLIQNPVPLFWAQTGPAVFDPADDMSEEFKNLYADFACTISDDSRKNDVIIQIEKKDVNIVNIVSNEGELLNSNDNDEIINKVSSNNNNDASNDHDVYNNSNNDDRNDDISCPEIREISYLKRLSNISDCSDNVDITCLKRFSTDSTTDSSIDDTCISI